MTVPTDHDPLDIVSTQSLECELKLVGGAAAGSLSGVFGPRSITWQVDREAAIFLGAGRALLLQLAHPWISAAVEQHSDTFANPIGRFHRTFGTVFHDGLRDARSELRRSAPAASSPRFDRGHVADGSRTVSGGLVLLRE
jgi:uncharacterized protein (DUF2236 family)